MKKNKKESQALPLAVSITSITFIALAMLATPKEYHRKYVQEPKPVVLINSPIPELIEEIEKDYQYAVIRTEADRARVIADIWNIDAKNEGNIHQLKKILTAKK